MRRLRKRAAAEVAICEGKSVATAQQPTHKDGEHQAKDLKDSKAPVQKDTSIPKTEVQMQDAHEEQGESAILRKWTVNSEEHFSRVKKPPTAKQERLEKSEHLPKKILSPAC